MADGQRVHSGGDPVAYPLSVVWMWWEHMLRVAYPDEDMVLGIVIRTVHLLQPVMEEMQDRMERDYEEQVKQAYESGIDACWVPDSPS